MGLDAGTEEVSTIVAVVGEAGTLKELLGTKVELDGVAAASTAFGVGKSLLFRASAPQIIYSKD